MVYEHAQKDFRMVDPFGFNLRFTRYVDTFEEEEEVDISANLKELEKLNPEIEKLEGEMKKYLKELNIK